MDAPPDRPWAEHEKVTFHVPPTSCRAYLSVTCTSRKSITNLLLDQVALLAEILKAAPVHANDLFRVLQELRVQPRWEEIALPMGAYSSKTRMLNFPFTC